MTNLAFYRGKYGNFWDKFICLVTRSEFSHVEAVFDNTRCWSSSPRDGGVRQTYINIASKHWKIIPVDISEQLFLQEKGKKYDWIGLAAPVLKLKFFSSKSKWFCSEIIAEALGLKDSWKYSPEDLYKRYS